MSGIQLFNEILFVAVFLILAVSMIIMTVVSLLRFRIETTIATVLQRRVDALQAQMEQLVQKGGNG